MLSILLFVQMEIFDKEYFLYSVIIPMANKAREEHGLKPIKVPKCLYAEGDPGILIMNNLKDKGFGLIKSREDGECVFIGHSEGQAKLIETIQDLLRMN